MERETNMQRDLYRTIQESDYQTLVNYFNLNNTRDQGIWCQGDDITIDNLKTLIDQASNRGNLVTQLHEKDGQIVSFYSGFERMNRVLYSVGIVNPELPNYMDIWRKDTAILFRNAVNRGNSNIYIHLSDDQAEIVSWLENEVGLSRVPLLNVWKANVVTVMPYITTYE